MESMLVDLAVDELEFVALQQLLGAAEQVVERPLLHLGRFEDWINRYLNHVFQHGRNYFIQDVASGLQARICVDFNQPGLHFIIQHEVIAKNFKGMLFVALFEIASRFDGNNHEIPHNGQYISEEVQIFISFEHVQVLLKFFKSHLIATFKFTVLAGFLLDGVVGEVDVLIGAVLHAELEA